MNAAFYPPLPVLYIHMARAGNLSTVASLKYCLAGNVNPCQTPLDTADWDKVTNRKADRDRTHDRRNMINNMSADINRIILDGVKNIFSH